jgi:NAD+ diphosphatase
MKIAEQVTFGASDLNRAAEKRGNAEEISDFLAPGVGKVLPIWRGKPFVSGNEGRALETVPSDHPMLSHAIDGFVFLGMSDGDPWFAADISSWEPDDLDHSQLGQFLDPTEQIYPDMPDGTRFAELRAVMTLLSRRDAELVATAKAVQEWHKTHPYCSRCGEKSDMTMSGWQRDCRSCGGKHFPRTDPVVIMLITHGNKVLMGRSPGWPEGMYSLLAGFVEPGETLENAVRRETMEEAGIPIGRVGYLSSQPWPFPASLMFGCEGEALDDKITIDPEEMDDVIWVSREDMLDVFAGTHPVLKPARKGAIAHFLLKNWLADLLE